MIILKVYIKTWCEKFQLKTKAPEERVRSIAKILFKKGSNNEPKILKNI